MKIDKNRFISEKNALVVKRKELQKEIAVFQQSAVLQRNISPPSIRSSNQRMGKVAPIPRRNKLKAHISNAFDKTKGTFKRFLT